jgi:hypothetical protein
MDDDGRKIQQKLINRYLHHMEEKRNVMDPRHD